MLGRGFKIVKILTLGKQFKFLLNFRMMLDQRIGKDEWWRTLNTCMDALGVVCECGVLFSSTWLSDDSCGSFATLPPTTLQTTSRLSFKYLSLSHNATD